MALSTLVALLPLSAWAQTPASTCRESGGMVYGRVLDDEGRGVPRAQVWVPSQNCGLLSGPAGGFEFRGLVDGDVVRAELIGYAGQEVRLEGVRDSLRVDLPLGAYVFGRRVIREFGRLSDHPRVSGDLDQLVGCYWMGARPWATEPDSILRLHAGGRMKYGSESDFQKEWSWDPVGLRLHLEFTKGSILSHSDGVIEVGQIPDWSQLPVRITSISDNLGPARVFETFAVRIACDSAG